MAPLKSTCLEEKSDLLHMTLISFPVKKLYLLEFKSPIT